MLDQLREFYIDRQMSWKMEKGKRKTTSIIKVDLKFSTSLGSHLLLTGQDFCVGIFGICNSICGFSSYTGEHGPWTFEKTTHEPDVFKIDGVPYKRTFLQLTPEMQ